MTIMDSSLGQRCRQAGVGLADDEVELVPVDPTWMMIAATTARYLRDELPGARVAHVGSTAVPGLHGQAAARLARCRDRPR